MKARQLLMLSIFSLALASCGSDDPVIEPQPSDPETPANPTNPVTPKKAKVAKISWTWEWNSMVWETGDGDTKSERDWEVFFHYDNDGNIDHAEQNYTHEYSQDRSRSLTYDYSVAGEINIVEVTKWKTNYYRAKLNSDGNVVTLQESDNATTGFEDYIYFSYNSDGRLVQWKDAQSYGEDNYSYDSNGLLVGYGHTEYEYEGESFYIEFSAADYANRIPNDGPIDMMAMLEQDDDYDFLFFIGRLGKTSEYMLERTVNEKWDDEDDKFPTRYFEPNTTYPYSRRWAAFEQWMTLAHTFNSAGQRTKTEITAPWVGTEYTADHVTGSTLNDGCYDYEVRNEKTTTYDKGQDIYTYAITYVE